MILRPVLMSLFTLLALPLVLAAVAQSEGTPPALKSIAVDETAFVEGNLHFIAYHELGHAMISEFKIPVLGREEDAVDRLAIWMMTPQEKEVEPQYLKAAIAGWFTTASQVPLSEIAWWDEHGTDQQRGYQIACLLYGSNPDVYKSIADAVDLPDDRRETCEFESKANDESWEAVQEPHFRDKAKPATGTAKVTYGDTKTYAGDKLYLTALGLLEHIAELIEKDYKFEPGIEVTASECDEPNAFWSQDDRRLTICYELVADFRELATASK
jgi:hypothetical protein